MELRGDQGPQKIAQTGVTGNIDRSFVRRTIAAIGISRREKSENLSDIHGMIASNEQLTQTYQS